MQGSANGVARGSLSKFQPFKNDGSWYESYWYYPVPTPKAPRRRRRILRGVAWVALAVAGFAYTNFTTN